MIISEEMSFAGHDVERHDALALNPDGSGTFSQRRT